MDILKIIKQEKKYQKIIEDIINVDKSNIYIPNRTFPDKAIDILDEIGARIKYDKYKNPSIFLMLGFNFFVYGPRIVLTIRKSRNLKQARLFRS